MPGAPVRTHLHRAFLLGILLTLWLPAAASAEERVPRDSWAAADALTQTAVASYATGATLLTLSTIDSRTGLVGRGGPLWFLGALFGSLEVMGGTAQLALAGTLRHGRVHNPYSRDAPQDWLISGLLRDHYTLTTFVVLPFQLLATFGGVVLASWASSEPWMWAVIGPNQVAALCAFLGGAVAVSRIDTRLRQAHASSDAPRRTRSRRTVRVFPAGLGLVGVF